MSLHTPVRIDGTVGSETRKAVAALGSSQRKQVVDTLANLQLPSVETLLKVEAPDPYDFATVVKAVSREARKRGLTPSFFIAQIALETGWGKSVPRLPNGRTSWNYAGLKYESVKSQIKGKVAVDTTEYIKGLPERVRDSFAVFEDVDQFARVYFWYLLDGPSSYRYKGLTSVKSMVEFADILQKGGYATDPKYAKQLVNVQGTVVARFGDVISNVA